MVGKDTLITDNMGHSCSHLVRVLSVKYYLKKFLFLRMLFVLFCMDLCIVLLQNLFFVRIMVPSDWLGFASTYHRNSLGKL